MDSETYLGRWFSHLGSSLFNRPDLCGPVVVLAPPWVVEWSVLPTPDPLVPVSEGTWVCSVCPLPDTWGSSLFAVSVWCGPPWIISSWRPWWPWRLPSRMWLVTMQGWSNALCQQRTQIAVDAGISFVGQVWGVRTSSVLCSITSRTCPGSTICTRGTASSICLTSKFEGHDGETWTTYHDHCRRGDRLYWPNLKNEDQRCGAFQ